MRNPGMHWAATGGKCLIPRRGLRLIWQPRATPTAPVAACWLHGSVLEAWVAEHSKETWELVTGLRLW